MHNATLEGHVVGELLHDVEGGRRIPPLRLVAAGQGMAALPPLETEDVLATPVAVVDEEAFLARVEDWLARRKVNTPGVYVVFRDVHGVVRALDEPALADAHRGAFMNVPDGAPLTWVCRLRGRRAGRVTGSETLEAVCRAGVAKGWRHAFYGSTPEVLDALVAVLEARHPGIEIVDAHSPPYRTLSRSEMDGQIRRLAAARPDFVWIGLGCPKQELWMARYARRLPGAIAMGVGAAFDFHAGTVKRAAPWMRRLGLEFLHRIAQEPRRLTGRYARTIPRFLVGIARQEVARQFRPPK